MHVTRDNAAKSKGHAWRDYYATYYDSPVDPVHIHEMTHQLFANRLHLNGGGSWFQEGVAEDICTSKNDRNVTASQVKKGRHVPLPEFVKIPSLLYSSQAKVTGEGGAAGDQSEQQRQYQAEQQFLARPGIGGEQGGPSALL